MKYLPYQKRKVETTALHLSTIDHKISGTRCNHEKEMLLRKLWDTDTALSGIDIEEVIEKHMNLIDIYAINYIVEYGAGEETFEWEETFAKMSHCLLFGVKRDLGLWRCVSKGYNEV